MVYINHAAIFRAGHFCRIIFLSGLLLGSQCARAQTQFGQKKLITAPATLQVRLYPLKGTATLMLQVANTAGGTTHILIRDRRGQTLYEGSDPKHRFALPLDMASVPVGLYTLEVSTWVARHAQPFRIGPVLAGRTIEIDADPPVLVSHENPD